MDETPGGLEPQTPHAAPGATGNRAQPMAIAALVLSVVGLCFFPIAGIGCVLALVVLFRSSIPATPNSKTMALVAIIASGLSVISTGILAAIAIPAFLGYVKRAKTAEAPQNLQALFVGAVQYYASTGQFPRSIPPTPATPACPEPQAWPADADPHWRELGFAPPPTERIRFRYEVESDPEERVLTFRALGDLDCDGRYSTFELAAAVDAQGQLYRGPDLFIENELE